jgi:hypothetical protein
MKHKKTVAFDNGFEGKEARREVRKLRTYNNVGYNPVYYTSKNR